MAHKPSEGAGWADRFPAPTILERNQMILLVAITLNESQVKRIGWTLGNYSDEITDEEECKGWIDATLLDNIADLP